MLPTCCLFAFGLKYFYQLWSQTLQLKLTITIATKFSTTLTLTQSLSIHSNNMMSKYCQTCSSPPPKFFLQHVAPKGQNCWYTWHEHLQLEIWHLIISTCICLNRNHHHQAIYRRVRTRVGEICGQYLHLIVLSRSIPMLPYLFVVHSFGI